jgi:hypothetical protein
VRHHVLLAGHAGDGVDAHLVHSHGEHDGIEVQDRFALANPALWDARAANAADALHPSVPALDALFYDLKADRRVGRRSVRFGHGGDAILPPVS